MSQIKDLILNTDASDWDSASTGSKCSKNLPVDKPEEELRSETLAPLPGVQRQERRPSFTEPQGAANATMKEGKEPSLLGTHPLPRPRSFKSHTSMQPQPQTHVNKESNKKPISDEGKPELCLIKPMNSFLMIWVCKDVLNDQST